MSLRSCCVVLGDQDGWGTNRLSKAESILGDWDVPKSITRPKTRLAGHEVQPCKDGVKVATGQGALMLRPGDTIPTPGEMAPAE